MSSARVPGQDAQGTPELVRELAVGAAVGAYGAAPQPNQSTGDQTKDVEMEKETSRTSSSPARGENLSGDSGYDSLNGIALSPGGTRRSGPPWHWSPTGRSPRRLTRYNSH